MPTVLVSVGTDHHRFDRLISWVDDWAVVAGGRARAIVQSGTSTPPRFCEWQPYFERTEFEALVSQSSAFVSHGGPGTISDARSAGFVPIVVPRRRDLREHVDDHQVRFCSRVAESGYIALADSRERFMQLLDAAVAGSPLFRTKPEVGRSSIAVARFAVAAESLLTAHAGRRARTPDPATLVPVTTDDRRR